MWLTVGVIVIERERPRPRDFCRLKLALSLSLFENDVLKALKVTRMEQYAMPKDCNDQALAEGPGVY